MAEQRNHDSELILNKDGSVYHLNLKGENIASTVFLVGDPDRVPLVSGFFDFVDFETRHREFVTHTGRLSGKRFSVISTGIGTDNIDIVLNELEIAVNFDSQGRKPSEDRRKLRLIRLGTSGAIQPDIEVGSTVYSEFGLGLDSLLHFYSYDQSSEEKSLNELINNTLFKENGLVRPYLFKGSEVLAEKLSSGLIKGITVTSPGFYGPQCRNISIPLRYPDLMEQMRAAKFNGRSLVNFEMETSAIYGLSRILGHEAGSLSLILANRSQLRFIEDPEKAISKFIRSILDKLVG